MFRFLAVALLCAWLVGCASTTPPNIHELRAAPVEQPKTIFLTEADFEIALEDKILSISSPVPPEADFFKLEPFLLLEDDSIFTSARGVVVFQAHWNFYEGILRSNLAGVMEMTVLVCASSEIYDGTVKGLQRQVELYYSDRLSEGYAGERSIDFYSGLIRGRDWVVYLSPANSSIQYSTALNNKRFLIIRFDEIKNSSDMSWRRRSDALREKLMGGLLIRDNEVPSGH